MASTLISAYSSSSPSIFYVFLFLILVLFVEDGARHGVVFVDGGKIPTTLEGPFDPVTVPLDAGFRGNAVDLPETDPRIRRQAKGFEPEQISVALSADYDSVWISWITGEFQIGDKINPLKPETFASVVRYGKLRFPLSHKATGYSLIYSQLYPFEGLQNYSSGVIHHVRLTGLKPGTLYYYRCGDPSIAAMSDIHFFRTMPMPGPRSYPERIAVVGDLGLTYNSTSTITHLTNNKPDLLLLVGDVTYANLYLTNGTGSDCYSCSFSRSPIHETYQPRWDFWGRYMQPLISKVPIMVVEGNHEIEEQAENKTFVSYSSRFAFPSEESGSSSTFYYSFNAGGIHFIMLGAYIDYKKSGDQYKWLKRDLANVDRSLTPWLVATWHPPWYSTYEAHYREAECMKVEMEELLYSYSVDIVFNGHVHAYERSNRVYNYSLDPCGPVYITVGDGGNREKMAVKHADEPGNCPEPSTTPDEYMGGFCAWNFTSGPAAGKFCWDRQPEYSAYRESSFGHGILEVKNETYALWTWHRNQDMYKTPGDQIYIVREPERCLGPRQGAAGGAEARPFVTYHNSLGRDLYLRIATELHWKRMLVGGFEKVYEIGRIFRNEGLSTRHNPEFTTIEMYEAYSDYQSMMNMAEEIIAQCALAIRGNLTIDYQGSEICLERPWRRETMHNLVKEATGIDFNQLGGDVQAAKDAAARVLGIDHDSKDGFSIEACPSVGHILNEVFETVVEPTLVQPTFVLDYPIEVSPLAKPHRRHAGLTERFELFICGRELANAFSELTDPIDQRERLERQIKQHNEKRAASDSQINAGEATGKKTDDLSYDVSLDEDFLTALEYGMPPPASGMGMGIDRLVMLLTNSASIRDVIAFPVLKVQQ